MAAPNTNKRPIIRKTSGNRVLYICPRCKSIWTQKKKMHKNLCLKCGQYLDWTGMDNIDCVFLVCQNMEEAYYSAKKYEEIVGTSYGLDLEQWRLKNKKFWPQTLYFPFLDHKDYGRFMRWVAKEGPTRLKMD